MNLFDLNAAFGPVPDGNSPELSADGLLASMDRLGIGAGCVYHTVAAFYDPATGNQRLLREIEGKDRLLPTFVVAPLEGGEFGTPEAFARAVQAHRVCAFRVFPRDHGWSLAGEEAVGIARVAEAAGTPLLVDALQTSWLDVGVFAQRFPRVNVIVSRVGYGALRSALALFDRLPNVLIDLSYFGSHEGVELVVERHGPDRIVYGSGTPFCDPAGSRARLAWAGITPEAREAIAAGNAMRLLPVEVSGGSTGPGSLEPDLEEAEPLSDLQVVDAHGHLGDWFAFFMPSPDLQSLLGVLDRCGVELFLFSSLLGVGPDTRNGNAEALAAAREHPERLRVYLVASPHRPHEADELLMHLQDDLVVGLKVHPDTHACPADSDLYDWIWDLAEEAGKPVLSHTQTGTPWSDPTRFEPVLAARPGLRLLMAHAAVTPDGFRKAAAVCRRHPNAAVDTCGSHITGTWIRWLTEQIGTNRVLFGSDAPFIDLRYALGRVLGAGFDDVTLRALLGGNARAFLGIPTTQPLATTGG